MERERVAVAGELPDVSDLSLHDLEELDDSVFAHALRTLLDPTRRDTTVTAGFQSYSEPVNLD
ncbi:FxSxx-COOH cyclophane-containing RiPP peptide [Actinomadura sp. B10D3]|uniref:FxSxx-COOH cyclophane-containing RiPP peptide n=1 Tax=Actinomadura sp. B10D3 TaxID=3153557 RepID=UPI00325DC4CE